eukprot:403347052
MFGIQLQKTRKESNTDVMSVASQLSGQTQLKQTQSRKMSGIVTLTQSQASRSYLPNGLNKVNTNQSDMKTLTSNTSNTNMNLQQQSRSSLNSTFMHRLNTGTLSSKPRTSSKSVTKNLNFRANSSFAAKKQVNPRFANKTQNDSKQRLQSQNQSFTGPQKTISPNSQIIKHGLLRTSQDNMQSYLNQQINAGIVFNIRKYRQSALVPGDQTQDYMKSFNLRAKSTLPNINSLNQSVTMSVSQTNDEDNNSPTRHNQTYNRSDFLDDKQSLLNSINLNDSITDMRQPRRLLDMKLFQTQNNQQVTLDQIQQLKNFNDMQNFVDQRNLIGYSTVNAKPSFKVIKDNDLLIGHKSPQHRRIPVQKKRNRLGSIGSELSSDESPAGKKSTTPYMQKQRSVKKIREQKFVTVSQKQLEQAGKSLRQDKDMLFDQDLEQVSASHNVNKKQILASISKMEFKHSDFRGIREALTSKQDFKILCGCLSLKQLLNQNFSLIKDQSVECQKLIELLYKVLNVPPAITDFYHDEGFYCFMNLGNLRYVQHIKESSKPHEIAFFMENFKEIFHSILDTIDLKLSECYWTSISELISETSSFPRFVTQLDIWDLLIKQFEMFLPSQSFQRAILYVILESGFKMTKIQKLGKQLSERLIEVVMDVFLRCSLEDKETFSYCLWSMQLYLLHVDSNYGAIITPLKNLLLDLQDQKQRQILQQQLVKSFKL